MEINDLTPAELRVWRAFPRGDAVDFREAPGEGADNGGGWGPERTLRAAVLRQLMLNGPREEGEIAALKVSGARITGELDVQYGTVDEYVRLTQCHFDETPRLYSGRFRQLNLSGSVLPGLHAATLRMDGVLRLTDCRFRGQVRLGGAQLAGAVFLDGAQFSVPDSSEPVLLLHQAEFGGDLVAMKLTAHGGVRLNGAHVTGTVNLREARLECAGDAALDAMALSVEGDLLLRSAHVQGWIGLRGARVAGRLDLSHARVSNPGDAAIRASSSSVGEFWLRGDPRLEGDLKLRHAQVDVLYLEPEKVPDRVILGNLVYATLTPHEPAERRLPMLERDGDGYVPHAYEQLTAAYRRIGDDHAARLVQLAKQRRHRSILPWYGRLWGHIQDATVGYGFRPMRALGWLLSLLAVGSVAFAVHAPPPLKADEAPDFNPVFYTLDLLLPVISFGQDTAFAPRGGYQTLSYVLIVTGWILATTVFAGVTRTISRQ